MTDDAYGLLPLVSRIVYDRAELFAITDDYDADWLEIVRPDHSLPVSNEDAERIAAFVRHVSHRLYHLALLSDGKTFDERPPIRLAERECRLFQVEKTPSGITILQASRPRASVALARLQIRGMLPAGLRCAGPTRAHLELLISSSFL